MSEAGDKSTLRYFAPIAIVAAVVAAVAIADTGGERVTAPPRTSERRQAVARAPRPSHVRWLAVGGGIEPGSNQVSIEQDLSLIASLMDTGGVTLFAGGPGHSPVQVQRTDDGRGRAGGLHRRLGDLFWPQDGRSAHYRPTTLAAHDDARAETVITTLATTLEEPSREPLFVFVAAHGEPGQEPRENLVRLWGGMPIAVTDIAETISALDQPRPLRLVMATCYSGGFAELAFRDARADAGPALHDRCGLFASTWDREAAGCDPNPDRRKQESYFLHIEQALRGQDRDGRPAKIDLDGDGRITLLEAHTQTRIASRSISIPTTTSERFLQHAASRIDGAAPVGTLPLDWFEEREVVRALRVTLSVESLEGARTKLAGLDTQVKALEEELQRAKLDHELTSADLRIALLERWPVLDDGYHPDYASTLARAESRIRHVLDRSEAALAHAHTSTGLANVNRALDELDVQIAMLTRLVRAEENLTAAAKLRDHDEASYTHFLRLLRCERATIPQRGSR